MKHQEKKDNIDKIFSARTTEEIIDVMRQEDEEAKRDKILKSLNPACRKKLKYFETWLRKEVDHCLRRRYELGLQALELYEDEKRNHGKLYGKNAIGRICTLLSWDEGLIRMALRFVRIYTPEDLDRLCSMVLPGGQPLTWSHVRALLTLEDATKRQELLDKTVSEGWTCNALAYEIKAADRGEEARGRPPRLPRGFDEAVAQQQESAEKWDRRFTRVWARPDRSLVTHAAKLSPDEVTEDRLRQARELAYRLRRVADEAVAQAEKAEEVANDFERILNERQQAETPAQQTISGRRKTS